MHQLIRYLFWAACLPIFTAAQQVGIGTSHPMATLHVAGAQERVALFNGPANMRIECAQGLQTLGFLGGGAPGKTDFVLATDAKNVNGSLHLGTLAQARLSIDPQGRVGIATQHPEATLDVAGSLRLQGPLWVGGTPGTTGQILTSAGPGVAPVWQSVHTPLQGNTRFGATLLKASGYSSATAGINHTVPRYNHDPANITIQPTQITLARGGLYHFEIGTHCSIDLQGFVPGLIPRFSLTLAVGSELYPLCYTAAMQNYYTTPSHLYSIDQRHTLEVFVPAGAAVSVRYHVGTVTGAMAPTHNFSGFINAHFITP